MTEKSFEDNDQSVYKTHILYYLPSDANCTKLLAILEPHPLFDDMFLQDVSMLRQRPPWLDGVPILVCKKDNQAYKGQHIQNYIKSYQSDDFLPAGSATGGWSSYDDGDTTMQKRFSTLHDPSLFDLEEEGEQRVTQVAAPSNQPMNEKQQRRKQSEMEAQQRAQEMMDVRQRQDQLLQSKSKSNQPLIVARNAFSGDEVQQPIVRHPPPNPQTMHQRAAEQRQPQYGQPQHYLQQPQQQQTIQAAAVPQFYAQQPPVQQPRQYQVPVQLQQQYYQQQQPAVQQQQQYYQQQQQQPAMQHHQQYYQQQQQQPAMQHHQQYYQQQQPAMQHHQQYYQQQQEYYGSQQAGEYYDPSYGYQ
jgi:hypothetical protein